MRETEPNEFPATSLLRAPAAAFAINEDELRERARLVEEKAREFEVIGTVHQIHPGPVVTTFEFKPEPGVKYSRITSLGDDLCLALEAESVRIDRIPGKSTVGMEVPNIDARDDHAPRAAWSRRNISSPISNCRWRWEKTLRAKSWFPISRRCRTC